MCRLTLSVAFAVLFAGCHSAETQGCRDGDDQCVVGADHALLTTKIQVSKLMTGKELASTERSKVSIEAQPVPPISMTMKCVISVTILYFVIHTALFLVSNFKASDTLEAALEAACDSVSYAPMISVLFIGTRMRAIAVTKGDPEFYGLPQWWCKDAMAVSACCVFALTICTIMEKLAPAAVGVLKFIQYAADALLYTGFAVVAYGLYSMDTPPALGASTPISDTAKCVMYLTLFFFFVAILYQIGETYDLITGKESNASGEKKTDGQDFTGVVHHALKALDFAPQICVLFLGARMRALQLGHSDPQPWALYFFFAATYALMVYSILVGIQQAMSSESKALTILETLSLVVIHVSTAAVIASVFTIEAVSGPTPFIATTVRVIMSMTVLYFFVHTVLFACEHLTEKDGFAVKMFTDAVESVKFVPMMCALFLGTRMRALQLSRNKGAPQGWAQDYMMIATWAMTFELIVVLATHCFGSAEEEGKGSFVSSILRIVFLGILHFSVASIIVSIFLQNVENTMANGADTLIPGIKIPGRA